MISFCQINSADDLAVSSALDTHQNKKERQKHLPCEDQGW